MVLGLPWVHMCDILVGVTAGNDGSGGKLNDGVQCVFYKI